LKTESAVEGVQHAQTTQLHCGCLAQNAFLLV